MIYQAFLRILLLLALYQCRTVTVHCLRISSRRHHRFHPSPSSHIRSTHGQSRVFRQWSMQEQTLSESQFLELELSRAMTVSSSSSSVPTMADGLDDESLSRQNELLKSRLKLLEFVVSFLRRKVADLSRALSSSASVRESMEAEEGERQQEFERNLLAFQQVEREKAKVSDITGHNMSL